MLSQPELGAMVVAGSRIEINQNVPSLNGIHKAVETELLQNLDSTIPEVFHSVYLFGVGLNVEAIWEFGPGLMMEVIKSPIGLGVKLSEANPLPHRVKPLIVTHIDGAGIKRYDNLSGDSVNDSHKASVGSRLSIKGLAETHFIGWVFLSRPFVSPSVPGKQDFGHKFEGPRRWLHVEQSGRRVRAGSLALEFPLGSVGHRQIVLFNTEQIL